MKKIIGLSCIIFSFSIVNAQSTDDIGRYQISANGAYIIDTTTGQVRPNNAKDYDEPFYRKSKVGSQAAGF